MRNYFRFLGLVVAILLQCHASKAQNPAFGDAFEQQGLPAFRLSLDTQLLSWLLADTNLFLNEYQPASLTYETTSDSVFTYTDIGVRLRGNTSRLAHKKSWKLHFTKFGGLDEFFGLKKVNLKGSHNDPTLVRERLAYWMFRQLNGPAPRVNNVRYYINDQFMGVYANVEQIGSRFLNTRFGNSDGNLYKCHWGANLVPGTDVYNNEVFELETNEQQNDRSDLQGLIAALDAPLSVHYAGNLEQVLNVDGLLKYLAVEVLTGHWDGYSYNKNNFYLYHNTATDQFEVIMYDPDNTFGIDWVNRDWGDRNIYDWANHGDERPLYTRVLAIEAYRNTFTGYVRELLDSPFNPDSVFPVIDAWRADIELLIASDSLYPLDYGFTPGSFALSYDQELGGHVDYGLKPFIGMRAQTAQQQLDSVALVIQAASVGPGSWQLSQQGTQTLLTHQSIEPTTQVLVRVFDVSGRVYWAHGWPYVNAGMSFPVELPEGFALIEIREGRKKTVLRAANFTGYR